jgi:outer membrane lipoprotein LolB
VSFSVRFLLLLGAAMLPGCATVPAPATQTEPESYSRHLQRLTSIREFSLYGRMAVQTERRGVSGSLRWEHAEESDRLAMFSPLGTQVAEIISGSDGVTLTTSDQKTYAAEGAETLMQQTMGWSLPMTGLTDWVLGRPAPGAYDQAGWDAQGRLTGMRQDGWQIEYPAYLTVDGIDMPGKILLKSPKLDLKLVVDRWESLTRGQ